MVVTAVAVFARQIATWLSLSERLPVLKAQCGTVYFRFIGRRISKTLVRIRVQGEMNAYTYGIYVILKYSRCGREG